MSVEDPVAKLIKDGQEKMGTSVQSTLLTQISCKLTLSLQLYFNKSLYNFNLAGLQTEEEPENGEAPSSRLALLLKLSVNHSDGFRLQEADRKYLEGWQHALMCVRSK